MCSNNRITFGVLTLRILNFDMTTKPAATQRECGLQASEGASDREGQELAAFEEERAS